MRDLADRLLSAISIDPDMIMYQPTAYEPTAVEWIDVGRLMMIPREAIRKLQRVCDEQAERIAALEQRLAETEEE